MGGGKEKEIDLYLGILTGEMQYLLQVLFVFDLRTGENVCSSAWSLIIWSEKPEHSMQSLLGSSLVDIPSRPQQVNGT